MNMESKINCRLCGVPSGGTFVTVRSGKVLPLYRCSLCDFDFFSHDPSGQLASDQLDQSRLKAAGLEIPSMEKDFANGLAQSDGYINEYLDATDRDQNILEIGCSWGYFLQLAQKAGTKPFGVEKNAVRSGYVERELKIPCHASIEELQSLGLKFKKIFLFYVLEYIHQPVVLLNNLLALLQNGGQIIMITPNLRDPLKDYWENDGFNKFFYDEHAINYFSPTAVKSLIARSLAGGSTITTRQGYSFANHVTWFLTNAPRTTGVVGGDNYIRDMLAKLNATASNSAKDPQVAARLAELISDFDRRYKEYLERHSIGNQIRVDIRK
jgi:2-polyprenyl-3-methyl-5-hydroxy-6-metoxy-1,4-benzoquinol methylase